MLLSQQSVFGGVKVVDGVGLKEVNDLCGKLGLWYERLSKDQKQSTLINSLIKQGLNASRN